MTQPQTTTQQRVLRTFADAETNLAASLPGYESRAQQQAFAVAVESAIESQTHLLAEAGCGCVDAQTRLTLADGSWVPISEVSIQSRPSAVASVLDGEVVDGVAVRATQDVFSSGVKPAFRLTTQQGYEVVATANHQFRTEDGWRRLDELVVGKPIAVATHVPVFGQERLPEHEIVLLALLICDGSLTQVGHGKTGSPQWIKTDPRVVAEMRRVVAEVGCRLTTGDDGRTHTISRIRRGQTAGRNLAGVLAERHGLAGTLSKHKVVPDEVFRLVRDQMALFLGRMWSGDGCIEAQGIASYASASQQLVVEIQHLLTRFGIQGRVRRHDGKIGENRYPAWTLEISGADNLRMFGEMIGPFIIGDKADRLVRLLDLLPEVGNPNQDLMPVSFWQDVDRARKRAGYSWYRLRQETGISSNRTRRVSRHKALAMARVLSDDTLQRWSDSQVSWLDVTSIESVGDRPVYDVSMAEGSPNFLAGNVVAHNCGKSLGYLIPAILSGKRTVVTTATKALQDQIAGKDLPFLSEHLGVPFTFALLKGRSNYLCVNRAEMAEGFDLPSLGRILARISEGSPFSGERDDLGFEVTDREWMQVCADTDDCQAFDCKENKNCYAQRAKERAFYANVVVVNHALYLSDLIVKAATGGNASLIGPHDLVAIDEAHELESIAGSALGCTFKEGGVRGLVTEIRNFGHRHVPEHEEALNTAGAEVLTALSNLWAVLEPGRIRQATLLEHSDEFVDFANSLFSLVDAVGARGLMEHVPTVDLERVQIRRERLRARAVSMTNRFYEVVTASFDDVVRWVEKDGEKTILKTSPIDVAPYLREHLFGRGLTTAILTSATLSVGGKFDYVAERIGVDNYDSLDVGTPFDYSQQAALYIPSHLPDPGKERAAWSNMATLEMLDLIKASEGRALVLFTSLSEMRTAYDICSARLPYKCMMQGQRPNKVLAKEFAEDTSSVLFATRSFMTGQDFQGSTCSLVIVNKLPFPVPTEPLTEAKCEAIKNRGGNDFGEYTIPVMSLVLSQAFGRLIRHKNDRGVVAILDPRLISKGYGRGIIRSLPDAPVISEIAEVEKFFAGLGA